MDLTASGQNHVTAPPAAVWGFLQDPEQVARCLPEVREVRPVDARHADATVQVGSGLLRGQLRLRLTLDPDEARGLVKVHVQGGGLGSTVTLRAEARVADRGDGTSRLDWQGQAELSGPVTRLGARQLDALAQRLVVRTFQTMSARMGASSGTLA
ncbi:SRPBCC domain-containing protein [Deinococcus hohokamensis]|uniref:SRPBCC domain-containing protein n=1 Tax=Deinococcus hohokamensis TaxID=309883 RepID=A0ABV9IBY5_9DEIO